MNTVVFIFFTVTTIRPFFQIPSPESSHCFIMTQQSLCLLLSSISISVFKGQQTLSRCCLRKRPRTSGEKEKEALTLMMFCFASPSWLVSSAAIWSEGKRLLSCRSPSWSLRHTNWRSATKEKIISWRMQLQWLRKGKWPIIIMTPELFYPSVSVGGRAFPPWRRTQLISERRRTTLLLLPFWLEAWRESCSELSRKTLWTICWSTTIIM